MSTTEFINTLAKHNWSTDDFRLAFEATNLIRQQQSELLQKAVANETLRLRIAELERKLGYNQQVAKY